MKAGALREFQVLSQLGDEELNSLFGILEARKFVPGRRLFNEGTEAEEMVLVLEGRVRLENQRTGNSECVEGPVQLGGLSLVRVGLRQCTARAETECSVLLLGRTTYRRLVDDRPRIACRLLEGLLSESAELGQGLIDVLIQNSRTHLPVLG